MKKVLFATTALVATAGMAAADVKLEGSADMGVWDNGTETQFYESIDLRFRMSGTTDNGLSFGAFIDLDDAVEMGIRGDDTDAVGPNELADFSVFVKGNFGTLTMGDTDGAFDWAMTEISSAMPGSIADDEEHAGYDGNAGLDGAYDGQILRYDYSFGAFSVGVSAELDDTGAFDPTYGIGLKYTADLGGVDLGFGVGYQMGAEFVNNNGTPLFLGDDFIDDMDIWGVSVDAKFGNGFRAVLNYWDMDTGLDYTGIGLGYSSGAIGVGFKWGEYSTGADGFGVTAAYDLGGGAELQLGYGDSSTGTDTWSLGVAMEF